MKQAKKWLKAIALGIFLTVVLSVSIWLWFFANCNTIKTLNTTAPGRCIE